MNKIIIIGNLTRDPELNTTTNGKRVCSFTVAVNKRTNSNHPEATYFRVSAWEQLADTCQTYLQKGKKVCVTGSVEARAYSTNAGELRAQMEVTAREVEFLSPAASAQGNTPPPPPPEMQPVDAEDVPW